MKVLNLACELGFVPRGKIFVVFTFVLKDWSDLRVGSEECQIIWLVFNMSPTCLLFNFFFSIHNLS